MTRRVAFKLHTHSLKNSATTARGVAIALVGASLAITGCSFDESGQSTPPPTQDRVEPTAESLEQWRTPGPNPLANYLQVEESADVIRTGDFVRGNLAVEFGAYLRAFRQFDPLQLREQPPVESCGTEVASRGPMPRAQGVLCEALTPPRTEAERLAQQQELAEAQTERDEYNSTLNATNEERAQNGQPPLPSLPEQVIAAPEVQMVFINDMPHSVQYRSLGLELLQCAWDAGFRHLAVEALEESSEQFASRGFVSRTQSGPFLREPRMARLVKEAQALGFAIVGFPAESPCAPANTDGQDRQLCTYSEMAQSARSREQAESLLSQTLGADSEAKVLVWTLPRQAYKGDWDVNGSSRSLAGHVNAIVNPAVFETVGEVEQVGIYSVEQVRIGQANEVGDYGSTNESRAATWPNYDECRYSHYTLTEPRAPTEVSLALYDALVIHQRPEDIREGARWSWTYAPDDERAVVNVNCDSAACSPGDQVLVQAFQADIADVSDRVPADQALCTIAEDCEFVLPSGSYQVRVWAETGAEPIGMVETVDFSAQSVSEIRID